jgi:DNA-binding YbaB/EbfC family protein
MVKKAQAVQTQMAAVQNKMENTEFTGTAANGAVEVIMTGKLVPVSVKLDKSVVNPDDIETLEDLIIVAMKNAKEKADDASDKAFESIKKSLNLPENFELPF